MSPLPKPRRRSILTPLLGGIILLGLASRKYAMQLPPLIADNAGDALWTVAVYLTLAIIWPRRSPWRLGLLALGISFAVEFSQFLHTSWLDAARATLPGRLLLGNTFVWSDLLRYTAGAVIAVAFDLFALHYLTLSGNSPQAVDPASPEDS